MKAESNIEPTPLSVEKCAGEVAEVIFCENISAINRNDEIIYTYDQYRTAVPYRNNLLAAVSKSKEAWLNKAKDEEAAALAHIPSLEERVTALAAENAKLRDENDTIGAALEETIAMIMEGRTNG